MACFCTRTNTVYPIPEAPCILNICMHAAHRFTLGHILVVRTHTLLHRCNERFVQAAHNMHTCFNLVAWTLHVQAPQCTTLFTLVARCRCTMLHMLVARCCKARTLQVRTLTLHAHCTRIASKHSDAFGRIASKHSDTFGRIRTHCKQAFGRSHCTRIASKQRTRFHAYVCQHVHTNTVAVDAALLSLAVGVY